ncbi:MAG: hypothetical protein ABSG33_06490 [Candidatus Bathyarchaeia archaeon]
MSETDLVFEIDHPYFIIRVTNDMLKIDVKGNVKNEIEEALENAPGLRETIGRILNVFVPLHIRLSDIDSVKMEKTGEVKIALPHRIVANIPLRPEEAEKLVSKLNQLIPEAKKRVIERISEKQREREIVEEDIDIRKESAQFPESPEEMHQEEKDIDEEIEREENPD